MEDKKFSEYVEEMTPRQAELELKLRDVINVLATQYSDVFNPGWLLGAGVEMFMLGGTKKEDIYKMVDYVCEHLEEGLKNPEEMQKQMSIIEDKGRPGGKN